MKSDDFVNMSCPAPINKYPEVILAHGGGGKLTAQLIEQIFYKNFSNEFLQKEHDGAMIPFAQSKLAFSTDSYVVSPLFFPGGDIGKLSVYGTVNDLAMCGAKPLYITASFIIEEGLPMLTLQKIALSMKEAMEISNVKLIAGDTKVVEKGKGDGVFINTTGIGEVIAKKEISPLCIKEGDAILISGNIGDHGLAIMSQREGLQFESTITSDCAFLFPLVENLLQENIDIHCLRDLTRGGLATILVELAQKSSHHFKISEQEIPITANVNAACEIMGLDPLYIANEGCFIAFIPKEQAGKALQLLKKSPLGKNSQQIGTVSNPRSPLVTIRNKFGIERMINMLAGEPLPRIC